MLLLFLMYCMPIFSLGLEAVLKCEPAKAAVDNIFEDLRGFVICRSVQTE